MRVLREARRRQKGGKTMTKRLSNLKAEFESHLPYSVFATASGIILAGILLFVATVATCERAGHDHEGGGEATSHVRAGAHDHGEHGADGSHSHEALMEGAAVMQRASHVIFHVFHPVHMLFSAIATTAMFWRYERRLLKAVIIGIVGSAGICSISDVGLPYLSGLLLGAKEMHFHWCLLAHPSLVVPFMVVGVVVGILAAETVRRSTYFSHAGHVFVSSAASLFYLVSFGLTDWPDHLGAVFVLMVLSVTVPCCFSDIAFPLLLTKKGAQVRAGNDHHH